MLLRGSQRSCIFVISKCQKKVHVHSKYDHEIIASAILAMPLHFKMVSIQRRNSTTQATKTIATLMIPAVDIVNILKGHEEGG